MSDRFVLTVSAGIIGLCGAALIFSLWQMM
jgi:hypothetical protein